MFTDEGPETDHAGGESQSAAPLDLAHDGGAQVMSEDAKMLEQLRTLYVGAHDESSRDAAGDRFERWRSAHDAAAAAKMFREAADMLPAGEPGSTELEGQARIEYSMYQRSPVDQTPRRWLRDVAGELAATAIQFDHEQADAADESAPQP